MSVVKCSLLAFSLMFLLTGAALIAVGAWIQANTSEYVDLLGSRYILVPIGILLVGFTIFILSFMGYCSAMKENYCMMVTFGILTFILLFVEVTASILVYFYRNEVDNALRENMSKTMKNYNMHYHMTATQTWNEMQSSLKCCGANNATEWGQYFDDGKLPYSCCSEENPTKECNLSVNYYKSGCTDALFRFLEDKILIIGGH
ncbi:CD63 antigen-like isoform X2 [Tachypleus tridentatus]|uniref:CD63 antigen-like isoform X2 n=1 Tax=Tachypleus tridentatus TaxID=6853 RepID=UPI003FD4EBF7